MGGQLPLRGREPGRFPPGAEFRIGNVFPVDVGKTEMEPFPRRTVQFVRREVVPHQVAAVVGKPEFPAVRVPVEPDGVPHPRREDLQPGSVGLHPQDRGIARVVPFADVARSPHRDVEHPVGPEADELPAVVFVLREAFIDDHRLGWRGQARFDPVVPKDPVDLGDVECSTAKCHAVGAMQVPGDRDDPVRPFRRIPGEDGIHLPLPGAHEERPLLPEGHRPGVGNIGVRGDPEARRKLDVAEATFRRASGRRGEQHHECGDDAGNYGRRTHPLFRIFRPPSF